MYEKGVVVYENGVVIYENGVAIYQNGVVVCENGVELGRGCKVVSRTFTTTYMLWTSPLGNFYGPVFNELANILKLSLAITELKWSTIASANPQHHHKEFNYYFKVKHVGITELNSFKIDANNHYSLSNQYLYTIQ